MRDEIMKQLTAARDDAYKEFNCRLIPGVDPERVLGIRVPRLRKIAAGLARQDYLSYISELPDDCWFEERMIHGMVIGYAKLEYLQWEELARGFVPHIHDWATCDSCSSTMKIVRKEPEKAMKYLRGLLRTDGEYAKRFGIVMMMDHFLTDETAEDVLAELAAVDTEKYYVMMAAAWAVSVGYVKYPQLTEDLLQSGALDDATQNKAIQKIRESYRVSAEEKRKVLEYKRPKAAR